MLRNARRRKRERSSINLLWQVGLWGLGIVVVAVPAWPQMAFTFDPPAGPHEPEELLAWDLESGEVHTVGLLPLGVDLNALAFSREGGLFGGDRVNHQLVTLDTQTGASAVVGPFGLELQPTDMTFDACGRLWAVGFEGETDEDVGLYRIDPDSGQATVINPDLTEFVGIAAIGESLFAATSWFFPGTPTPSSLFELDPQTGALTFLIGLEPEQVIFSGPRLDFDAGGQLWAMHLPPDIPNFIPAASRVDRQTGSVETASLCLAQATCVGFAIAPPVGECTSIPPVEVPALSFPAMATLAVTLLLLALATLRRSW